MSFDENNIIFKQYFIPDKYDKSLIFSKTLQDYIDHAKGLSDKKKSVSSEPCTMERYWSC